MKSLIPLVLLSCLAYTAHASVTINPTFTLGIPVPDNTGIGLADTRTISTTIASITKVKVQISMQGGWAGDMYASLLHGTGFVVLLNRPGKNLARPEGSGVNEFILNLDDAAPADIHTAITDLGVFSGSYQPDAREIDPDAVLDTSPRTAFLSSFNGLDANGEWTLFVADVASGDQMTVNSWALEIQGVVPEPSTAMITAVGMLGLLRRRREKA
jgi:subtilisin-like proprotein convertase family protein